jgi:acetyltransferase-like isoleucine patch superfamily enzyme
MRIVIIGAGSEATEMAGIVHTDKTFKLVGFVGNKIDAKKFKKKPVFLNYNFIGLVDDLKKKHFTHNQINGFIVGVGDTTIKEKHYYRISSYGLIPVNVISKNSIVKEESTFGRGIFISDNVIISSGVILGDNISIGLNSQIESNSQIHDHVSIRSKVVIEQNCIIGKNAQINSGAMIEGGTILKKRTKIKFNQIVKK